MMTVAEELELRSKVLIQGELIFNLNKQIETYDKLVKALEESKKISDSLIRDMKQCLERIIARSHDE